MSITANSQLPNLSKNQEAITSNTNGSLAKIGAELVYTQDATGRYLTFYWQKSEEIVIEASQETFAPVDKIGYLEFLQRILKNLTPQRYQCWFSYHRHLYEWDLTITPILPRLGSAATTVLVMGRLLQVESESSKKVAAPQPTQQQLALRSQQHQKLVNQITRNIRRTLDLDIIWQQTVDSLGQALEIERCIICPYQPASTKVQVIAEYHRPTVVDSMLGLEIDLAQVPGFSCALSTLEPIVVENPQLPQFEQQRMLLVATCYQDQPNGLICVTISNQCAGITADELELAKDVADQLGTAIAHATLYRELEAASQQAEEATRRIREFLANVTHELRTPLNGIIGFLKLILEGMADDPEEQTQFLQEAHKSSLYLLDIINDILDIARIEADKMELELRSIKLDELFSDVENFMRIQAEQRNLSFGMQMPDTCDEIMIYGDYQRLKQVMLNLLGNAIKFTHEGGVTVTADVVRKKVIFQDQQFPGMVRVRVADTGIGVSLDKQDKLFQLFSQVDSSRTRQYGGTGLGLAISQKLVEAMGGEVNFYSLGEGLGSTVTFTVPLYQQPVMVSTSETNCPE
ncbi:ATP-binding protein [Iningainema tapete]|uniref:Circadian input-output histidine kinase CikA n=1 Tax=Iningainema tapete BLCC-T55 TaxID=2748662 RepID=A0A8J6XFJ8_9CYAN|nr:ATP-binding protein [Iningainema tapete]MBD2770554.1 GAF domain-containing protein [Iningainema tapete BLCC-T55]